MSENSRQNMPGKNYRKAEQDEIRRCDCDCYIKPTGIEKRGRCFRSYRYRPFGPVVGANHTCDAAGARCCIPHINRRFPERQS